MCHNAARHPIFKEKCNMPSRSTGRVLLFVAAAAITACGGPNRAIEEKLNQHVILLSNFEKGMDALSSRGKSLAQIDGARSSFHASEGRTDGYVEFQKESEFLGYKAEGNFPYSRSSFGGTVSFWLSADPEAMESDFPEPFHIGKRVGESLPWDDAVISVDFSKPPRALRFACYPDKTGEATDAETDAMVNERTIKLDNVSWKIGEWHHVVITWKNFNSGAADAEWALFVDKKEIGRKSGLRQDLTWDVEKNWIRFNHYQYTGSIDDIVIFDTMLAPEDVAYLYSPKKPIKQLLKREY